MRTEPRNHWPVKVAIADGLPLLQAIRFPEQWLHLFYCYGLLRGFVLI
jgi:hypothetical protein